MPSSPSLQRGTSSSLLSVKRPSKASPARPAAWCRSSTRSSSSLATRRERERTPTSLSPSSAPTGIQVVGSCGRGFATCSSASRPTASCWRCWTWGSYREFEWSTTTRASAPAGCSTGWRSPTRPTASPPFSSAGSGWTLRGLTDRLSESSTQNTNSETILVKGLTAGGSALSKIDQNVVASGKLYISGTEANV